MYCPIVYVVTYYSYLFFFFFSSRRRHTRCLSDWSSDVCSSDLFARLFLKLSIALRCINNGSDWEGRLKSEIGRSEERRVGKSVDLGGRRIIKKKKEIKK